MNEQAPSSDQEERRRRARARRAQWKLNELQALKLRALGMTYQEIGDKMGITRDGAHKSVTRALAKVPVEDLEAARQLELQRLDTLLLVAMGKAVAGELRAIDTVLRIMERRAKMLGLDAPTKIDITRMVEEMARDAGFTEDDIRRAVEEAQRIARADVS